MLNRAALYLRTVRWLRLSQLAWYVYRQLRPVTNPASVAAEGARGLTPVRAFLSVAEPDEAELRFLNVAVAADPDNLDWHPADKSRLWRYNLHYFDYLQWSIIPESRRVGLIDSWLAANPVGCEDAWEPYTVSLRIVNWVKFFARCRDVPAHWQESLLYQAHWLAHNLEHHILANHYYKNAKALVFAGAWFAGPVGEKLLQRGAALFMQETREQILADGGHLERAPMYHCIVLEDCLDVLNLMQSNSELFRAHDVALVRDAATRALRFLDETLVADGAIPLFNDSAHGIAPEPRQLLDYGAELTGYEPLPLPRQPLRVHCPDSGYYGYRHLHESLLIDCGDIGPDYQPGHAHCDLLSYELCIDGHRVIVDPGMHGYENDKYRSWLRSTAAHNTIEFNATEQSEIWGNFRVGRRARPVNARLSQVESGQLEFTGGHDGYLRLPQKALHARRIKVELGRCWEVSDVIDGQGEGVARSFIHFAPDIVLQKQEQYWWLLRDGAVVARLEIHAGSEVQQQSGYVTPEFGVCRDAAVLVILTSGPLPLRSGYKLTRHDGVDITASY